MNLVEFHTELREALACPRVHRENDFEVLVDLKQRLEDDLQNCSVINVRWSMKCDQSVASRETVLWVLQGGRKKLYKRIDHYVADSVNLFRRDSLVLQILIT